MHTKQSNAYEMYTNRKERVGDFTWKVSDCEELVGFLTGDDGVRTLVFDIYQPHSLIF